ncbi:MAG: GPW/gp25 family protein [Desulfobacterales bacterium]|nr:GPW/gp25 family protein [Desulfobacterales bacterium]
MTAPFELAYPFELDRRGRTAGTDEKQHVRDLIEQVLFTAPGERVNRPDFGSGLLRLAFEPNGDILEATTQFTVQGALQQWLGDRIELETVAITHHEATLEVTVAYRIRQTAERVVDTFQQGV